MPLANYDHVIEAFSSDRADQSLRIAVLPRRSPAWTRFMARFVVSDQVDGIYDRDNTAQAIPGAKLEIVPSMGHDLPPGLVPTLSRIIPDHCRTVDAVARDAA
jgi:hypothetical protein